MGSLSDLLFGSGSKWNADTKMDKRQHRNDILGFRTSSRPNHEPKKAKEDARRAAKKEKARLKREQAKAEGKFFY